jgi:hypothetical protein
MMRHELHFPSAKTVKSHLKNKYATTHSHLKALLKNLSSKISLTLDLWTSPHVGLTFMGVTIHFIDELLRMHSLVAGLAEVTQHHTGKNLSKTLSQNVVEALEISGKVINTHCLTRLLDHGPYDG